MELHQLAVDKLPTDTDALIGLGYALWYGGFPADADATFSQAIIWDGSAVRAYVGRGQVRAEMRGISRGSGRRRSCSENRSPARLSR